MDLKSHLQINPFVLAPMAGITDHPFRTLMRRLESSVVVSELISANGIEYENQRTLEMMGYDNEQRPVGLQLFGEDPDVIARGAQVVEATGVDFVDLNFGCPVPKVVKKGGGSAMLKDLPQFQKVLSAVVAAVKIPVTIKIRTGWDLASRNATEACRIAAEEGIAWVAIHGRTRAQQYEGHADWEYIGDVASKVKIPILGNGDIHSAEEANHKLKTYGCAGVMIGRGALKNPFIFKEALALWQGKNALEPADRDYVWLMKQLNELYSARCGDQIRLIQLKKFGAWFSAGYPDSSHLRRLLFQAKDCSEVLDLTITYFMRFNSTSLMDTREERFLMGGHG
jgi:tRNA-dihydrouridine synthase B